MSVLVLLHYTKEIKNVCLSVDLVLYHDYSKYVMDTCTMTINLATLLSMSNRPGTYIMGTNLT